MSATQILIDGTIKAAGLIAWDKGIDPSTPGNIDKIAPAIKATLKAHIEAIFQDWNDALKAHLTEPELKNMINIQCNWLALEALKLAGLLE